MLFSVKKLKRWTESKITALNCISLFNNSFSSQIIQCQVRWKGFGSSAILVFALRDWGKPRISWVSEPNTFRPWLLLQPTRFVWLFSTKKKTKLHGLSPRANYTDRATAACRRSDCQLVRIEGVSVTDLSGRILGFLDRSRYFSIK
jgi:hypothetical protein